MTINLNEINWNDPLFTWFNLEAIEKFKKFHGENPQVYSEFRRLARQIKNTGRKKYSVDAIIHVIRWNSDIMTSGGTFKISNNIRSIYGRLLAFCEPEFRGFFNIFKNKGDVILDDGLSI